jgi:HAD superfamily hydrolase (TIGR01549 family)
MCDEGYKKKLVGIISLVKGEQSIMIKAVFFDWFNTLAQYYPPREEVHARICQEFGIEVEVEALRRSLPLADHFLAEKNTRSPINKLPPEEQAKVYFQYENVLLKGAGIEVPHGLAFRIIQKVSESFKEMAFSLFDDVLPTLEVLKQRGLILGLISNISQDIAPFCQELGLASYLDFIVTSQEIGSDKPHPPIFLAALERAGVEASEMVYVGDQYSSDVIGARGVGIKPVLLDRFELFTDFDDCPRIESLDELIKHL